MTWKSQILATTLVTASLGALPALAQDGSPSGVLRGIVSTTPAPSAQVSNFAGVPDLPLPPQSIPVTGIGSVSSRGGEGAKSFDTSTRVAPSPPSASNGVAQRNPPARATTSRQFAKQERPNKERVAPSRDPSTDDRKRNKVAYARGMIIKGDARAVDGDTLMVDGVPVRLFGVDAPEPGQHCRVRGLEWECGAKASRRLADLVAAAPVRCTVERPVGDGAFARCGTLGTADIAQAMLRDGLAVVAPKSEARYVKIEATSRDQRRGVWSGEFVPPWKWRKMAARLARR